MKSILAAYECDNPACKKVATTLTPERLPYRWCHVALSSETFFDNLQCEPRLHGNYYVCSEHCAEVVTASFVKDAYGDGVLTIKGGKEVM